MAKKVQFIEGIGSLSVPGIGVITSDTLTFEKYERIMKISEGHAKLFVITEEKPKSQSNDIQTEK